MDYSAVERARERLEAAAKSRTQTGGVDPALEGARAQIQELAELGAQLQGTPPGKIGDAVQEGLKSEALPVARQLAEVRGLANQTIRRLEPIAGDHLSERHPPAARRALPVDL